MRELRCAALLRKIGSDVDEGDVPMFRAEEACGVVTPRGGQHHLGVGLAQNRPQACDELGISNIGKLARIWRAAAIEHTVDVRKDDLHERPVWMSVAKTTARP